MALSKWLPAMPSWVLSDVWRRHVMINWLITNTCNTNIVDIKNTDCRWWSKRFIHYGRSTLNKYKKSLNYFIKGLYSLSIIISVRQGLKFKLIMPVKFQSKIFLLYKNTWTSSTIGKSENHCGIFGRLCNIRAYSQVSTFQRTSKILLHHVPEFLPKFYYFNS